MCGVIGTLALGTLDKKEEKIRQEAMRFLATELLQVTVDRGKEATGISTLFNNGDYMMLKMGISAPEFIARFGGTETDYDGYMKVWRKNIKAAKVCIGHCRKPSTGGNAGAWDNNNNHPIRSGDIVGVHMDRVVSDLPGDVGDGICFRHQVHLAHVHDGGVLANPRAYEHTVSPVGVFAHEPA